MDAIPPIAVIPPVPLPKTAILIPIDTDESKKITKM